VRSFRMGGGAGGAAHGGEWTHFASWPPPGSRLRSYYLQEGGSLGPERSRGQDEIRHDPANPVPSVGGRYTMVPTIPPCAQDQSRLDGRPDILRFQTQPLAEPVEVAGMVRARLWVSSSAASTDFTAKLIDAAPDGFALILGDGIRRVSIPPGQPRMADVEIGSVHNLFARGHRIRLDVASSNYPRAETNPESARNTVFHDARRASALELPVLGSGR